MSTLHIRHAALVGLALALVEGLLLYLAEPGGSRWVLLQSVSFWFGCGCVLHLLHLVPNRWLSALLVCLLLNIPWYIALTVVAGHMEHLLPLLMATLLMSGLGAWLSQRLHRRLAKQRL